MGPAGGVGDRRRPRRCDRRAHAGRPAVLHAAVATVAAAAVGAWVLKTAAGKAWGGGGVGVRALITADPQYAACAHAELEACLPAGAALSPVAPGVWALSCAGALAARARDLGQTVFVRHVSPIQCELPLPDAAPPAVAPAPLTGAGARAPGPAYPFAPLLPPAAPASPASAGRASGPTDAPAGVRAAVDGDERLDRAPRPDAPRAVLAWLEASLLPALAGLRGWPPAPGTVQAQVRVLAGGPRWPAGMVAAVLRSRLAAAGVVWGGGAASTVLSVVWAADRAYVGLAPRALHLSPWPGGEVRLRREPDEVSRSARKLEEAMLLFGVPAGPPVSGATAVDLGAAPGGWTQFLLREGWRVVAVDSAAPSPQLEGWPHLSWVRGAALAVALPTAPCHLLVADLSWDPVRAADCVLRFGACLAPGAWGLCTIKFFGQEPLAAVAAARRRLERGFHVLAVRHLFHQRAEAMALLRARG